MKEIIKAFGDRAIRMVVLRGEPWFVAKDICDSLGYANAPDALSKHCKGVAKRYPLQTPGGMQEARIIAEPDLYRLIIGSHLPAAEAFERWVFEEVLPSIRKTGAYSVSAQSRRESAAARTALTEQWHAHGASNPYHYINLTRSEYAALFGDKSKKKADMTAEERATLMIFEAVEQLKLIKNQQISGYHALSDSLQKTAAQLPLYTTMAIQGATA